MDPTEGQANGGEQPRAEAPARPGGFADFLSIAGAAIVVLGVWLQALLIYDLLPPRAQGLGLTFGVAASCFVVAPITFLTSIVKAAAARTGPRQIFYICTMLFSVFHYGAVYYLI